jgi:hypothetical protein
MRLSSFIACVLMFCGAADGAESPWTITTADFQSVPAPQLMLDEQGATYQPASGERKAIPWDQILQSERDGATSRPGGAFMLHLVTGDRIAGAPTALDGETLRWKSDMAGDLSFPMRQVSYLGRADRQPPRDAEPRTEDSVQLANGDVVRGIVAAISAKDVTIQGGGGAPPAVVPLESVVAMQFVSSGPEKDPSQRTFRVSLSDGSRLTGSAVMLSGEELTLTLPSGESRKIPAAHVSGIEQANGPVAWLSSFPSSESEHTPLFETVRPARMDQAVTGDPIRFGDRAFRRGIGVHSRSIIRWPLDGTYKSFRTQYAMDGELPYANVTVRIRLDDKVVHERADFGAGELSPVVQVPLENAKQLVLEVDYGRTYDVQDRFNWIEPALLKQPAAPAPATQP